MGRVECADFSYYDTAIGSCTPCDHLCDQHEYQGTTDQCIDKCYKYYERMQRPHPDPPETDGGVNQTGAIVAGLVSLLVLGLIAAGLFYLLSKKKYRCCRRKEKRKPPVTCSEDDIDHVAESQRSLIKNSMGPIRQPVQNPQCGPGVVDSTLALLGIPHSVLDQQYSSRSDESTVPRTYTESGNPSHISNIVGSTIPKTYSDSYHVSNETDFSSTTTPKVLYTREDGTRDLSSSRAGTIAEYSSSCESDL